MILCMQALDDLRNKPEDEWRITDGEKART
jgi:hypothetical protein